MPLPSVTFRSELDTVVRKELDQLDSELTEYLLQEHDDDGQHGHITAKSITVSGGTHLTSPVSIDGVPVTGAQPSATTFFYRADIQSQAPNDPGSGRLRWNTVNQHLATALYVDRLTDDGFDAMLFLELSHIADRFVLQDASLPASYQVWHLTGPAIDHVDWFELPVAFESSSGPGTFGQLDRIAMLLQTGGGGGVVPGHHATHETGGPDAITSLSGAVITTGTVADARLSPNVALLDRVNTFTTDNAFQTGLFERGRSVRLGAWSPVPFNAANFAGTGGMTWTVEAGDVQANIYAVIGQALIWSVLIVSANLSGTASNALTMTVPPGWSFLVPTQVLGQINLGGAWGPAIVTHSGGATLTVYRIDTAAMALGDMYLTFQIIFPII